MRLQIKIFVFVFCLLTGLAGFCQQKDSIFAMKQTKIYVPASDSAKVTLDVVIDSSGKCISATYVVDGSTTRDRNMIDVAKRRASELKYKTTGEMYTQRLIFDFTIVK